jgi:hypothetical protein
LHAHDFPLSGHKSQNLTGAAERFGGRSG